MTDIQIAPKYSEVKPQGFYVYTHARSGDGAVFYVGKGKDNRAWVSSRKYNKKWVRVASKHGVIVNIVKDNLSECCAFTLEKLLIAKYGIDNLVNHTLGGEGTSGRVCNQRQKELVSNLMSKAVKCSNGMSFNSIKDAVSWLVLNGHVRASTTNISSACSGKKAIAYGYAWAYLGDDVPEIIDRHAVYSEGTKRPLIAIEIGMVFPSSKDAADWLINNGSPRASKQNISACASGKRKKAYGYSWEFV